MFGVFDERGLETQHHLSSAECEGSSCPAIQLQLSPEASTMGTMALGEFMLTLIINPYSQPLKGSNLSDSQGLPKDVWYRSNPRALMFLASGCTVPGLWLPSIRNSLHCAARKAVQGLVAY